MGKRTVLIIACMLVLVAIGPAPRLLEELRIGGGFGEPVDGGADFEKDGDILTDGSVTIGGSLRLPDDTAIFYGTDSDIQAAYDEAGDDRLEFTDGTNLLMALLDGGTTGKLIVTSEIRSGSSDTLVGSLLLYGASSGQGGELKLYNAANKDTNVDYWHVGQKYATEDFMIRATGGESGNREAILIDGTTVKVTLLGDLQVQGGDIDSNGAGLTLGEAVAITGNLQVNGGNVGITADTDLLGLASGVLNVNGNMKLDDAANIGCDSDTDLVTLAPAVVKIDGTLRFAEESAATISVEPPGSGDGDQLTIYAASGDDDGDDGGDLVLYPGNSGGGSGEDGNVILAHTGGGMRGFVGVRTNDPQTALDVAGALRTRTVTTFTANDTTPSVSAGNIFKIPDTWTVGNNITDFDDGYAGQTIRIYGSDTDCTIVDGGSLNLTGNWTPNGSGGHDSLVLTYYGTNWNEDSRSAN